MADEDRGWNSSLIFGFVEHVRAQTNVLRIRPARQGTLSDYKEGQQLLIRILDVAGDSGVTPGDILPHQEVATATVAKRDGLKELEVEVLPSYGEDEDRRRVERLVAGIRFDILGGF